jgi:hypothetical protein
MTQLIHVFGAGISQLNTSKNFKNLYFYIFLDPIFIGKDI